MTMSLQAGGLEDYTVSIPDAVLKDLMMRLERTRWPSEPASSPWQFGTDRAWMKAVAAHWRQGYDWRRWEARINVFPQYRTPFEGKRLHFILEQGSGSHPLPLLLSHGWPGSIVEFLEVVGPLAHPERYGGDIQDAFTVVVPSLPGYGFSDAPDSPISARDVARRLSYLMTQVLGFDYFVAQGGDWGGIITGLMGLHHPDRLRAMHLNIAALDPAPDPDRPFTAEEQGWMTRNARRRADQAGYRVIQGTRPQTLAYGLTDSPVGLAAWILEKFHDWTVRGQPSPPPFDLDHLLTNVMLYWLGDANAASWLYVGLMDPQSRIVPRGSRVMVPTGFTLCPEDLGEPPPTSWLERAFNVVHREDAPSGGHFFALEQGRLFVDTVRRFFRPFR